MDKNLYRLIDANFNRAKEGLRVCEDITRYVTNQKSLTRSFKDMRHDLSTVLSQIGFDKMMEGRDVKGDVGRPSSESEMTRKDVGAVLGANIQRVKESLRVLEEVAKLFHPKVAEELKTLRYQSYVLEQKAFRKG